ncbi:MAG TPA: hypothetical protein VLI39_02360 [Sedimentisphaerales bacterium]|nr:hypothetical protein [Sedimentisphaerales bacterium]
MTATATTTLNREKIVANMSKIQVRGDARGIIEGFNVFVTQLPAKFWNSFADRLVSKVEPEMVEATEYLLINAAHECGYHTGYGIITSDEWNAVVQPMVKNVPEDILHGAYAVFTAWGWANSEIVELIPGEKMVVRAYDYYEADVVAHGRSNRPSAYMIRGVSAAFMDLAYGGSYDPTGKTGLRTFKCEQTKGIECGDDYGEFVVTRA